MDPSSTSDHLSVTPSDRALAQLDRDVARSFLNVPISMRVGQGVTGYSPLSTGSETYAALPPNVNLNPAFYCDVIVETVTDYDIFYLIGKETRKYYSDVHHRPSSLIAVNGNVSDDPSAAPRHSNGLLDELTVSIDFPDESDFEEEWPVTALHDERMHPEKNVRFKDYSTSFPCSRDSQSISHSYSSNKPSDHQYYFPPEMPTHLDDEHSFSSPTRYIHAPSFWFQPVLNHDYALCIPSTRPSLHAYQSSPFDPTVRWNLEPVTDTSRTRSIRL